MDYTIAVIENVSTGRKIHLCAHGNKKYLVIEEGGRTHITDFYSKDEANVAFEELCRFTYLSLYSFDQICKKY